MHLPLLVGLGPWDSAWRIVFQALAGREMEKLLNMFLRMFLLEACLLFVMQTYIISGVNQEF